MPIKSGRLSMSSRWISMSLSGVLLPWRASATLTPACDALTSDDLPMPRAPHRSALLAGSPLAKRSVFSTSTSRTRSMPLSSDISTRLTRLTGASRRPSGCQMNASAPVKSGASVRCGASRSSASAMRASTAAPSAGRVAEDVLALTFDGDLDFDLAMEGTFGNCAALSGVALPLQAGRRRNGQKWPALRGLAALQLERRPL